MSEDREILLVGGPCNGRSVKYPGYLIEYKVGRGGRYLRRQYEHPAGSTLELLVWKVDDDE